jgi:hypothetical protein
MAVKIVHYDIGDLWTPEASWTVNGGATDPTQIVVKQQTPAGVESTVTTASSPASLTTASTPLSRQSAGVYRLNPGIALTAAGYWFVRFEGTGAAQAAEEQQAIVDPSEFTSDGGLSSRALVSLAEMKDWLNQQNIDTSSDLEIVAAINSASELAHDEAQREFKRTDTTTSATARIYSVDNLSFGRRFVQIDDLSTTPTLVRVLANDRSTVVATVTDYNVYPNSREAWAPITGLEFENTVLRPRPGQVVEVTGVWGFPAIPDQLKQAVKDAVAEMMDRDVEHYRQDYEPHTSGGATNVIIMGSRPSFLAANPRSLAVFRSFRTPHLG